MGLRYDKTYLRDFAAKSLTKSDLPVFAIQKHAPLG
jgi:hypothetical protein